MFSKATIAITSLLALAEAVKVTKPAKGDDWDLSETNEIEWETVSSDPKSFEIVVINQSSYPGVSQTIAKVNAADGKYELKDLKVAPGDSYRINLVSTDPQNSGILAQSEEFALTGSDDDSSSASASATASASASASGSASASASATGSSSESSATGSATKTASGLTTVTGSATATASGVASSGSATGTATGTAASGTSSTAPNSASGIKSTFAIFGSVAVAAYMLF